MLIIYRNATERHDIWEAVIYSTRVYMIHYNYREIQLLSYQALQLKTRCSNVVNKSTPRGVHMCMHMFVYALVHEHGRDRERKREKGRVSPSVRSRATQYY